MGVKKSGDAVAKLQARLAALTARKCQALTVELRGRPMLMMGCPSGTCKACDATRKRIVAYQREHPDVAPKATFVEKKEDSPW